MNAILNGSPALHALAASVVRKKYTFGVSRLVTTGYEECFGSQNLLDNKDKQIVMLHIESLDLPTIPLFFILLRG